MPLDKLGVVSFWNHQKRLQIAFLKDHTSWYVHVAPINQITGRRRNIAVIRVKNGRNMCEMERFTVITWSEEDPNGTITRICRKSHHPDEIHPGPSGHESCAVPTGLRRLADRDLSKPTATARRNRGRRHCGAILGAKLGQLPKTCPESFGFPAKIPAKVVAHFWQLVSLSYDNPKCGPRIGIILSRLCTGSENRDENAGET